MTKEVIKTDLQASVSVVKHYIGVQTWRGENSMQSPSKFAEFEGDNLVIETDEYNHGF